LRLNAKTYLYIIAGVGSIIVTGCVTASKVTSTASGIYVIQGRAVGPWNADKERTKALTQATAFCMRRSQRVVLHNIDESGHAALLGERATITFECES
jgi:hypothetical protein